MRWMIIAGCLLASASHAVAWEANTNDIPRDNSYTLQSAYAKYRKHYPHIRPAQYEPVDGSMRQVGISYHWIGHRPLRLDVFSVMQPEEPPKPVVFLIHGGGWSSGDRSLMHPLAGYLSKHGYVAIAVEYRLSPEAPYPAAVDDIKHALDWVLNDPKFNIDPDRIAILGGSAGAQLAGLVGLTYGTDDSIDAIVNIDGVMDFTCEEALKNEDDPSRESTPASRWFGARHAEKPELWKEASPIYYVDGNAPPILFINSSQPRFHAGRDAVIAKLDGYSIYSEVSTFDAAPHSFWLFDPWFEPTGACIVQFLDKVLKGAK